MIHARLAGSYGVWVDGASQGSGARLIFVVGIIRELCLRTGKRSRDEMAFQLHLFVPPFFCLKSSNRSRHVFRDIPVSIEYTSTCGNTRQT